MTNLTYLHLSDSAISDVSALSGLVSLEYLNLSINLISDISALSNLPNLTDLYLSRNTISDLSPLVANTGLGSGDEVDVRNNPLSATSLNTHIPILQGRGVNVQFGASKPTIEKIEPGSRFKQGIMPR
ncbi:MAG: leucine-rich repeat domain-containing protein [Gemmatimonadota bacterium]|nr:leucine-rich repeat domain-containing protein [Gemmatimonadota bacterium]